MLSSPKHASAHDKLSDRIRSAQTITPDLVSDVLDASCVRLPCLNRSGIVAERIARLRQSSAWVDLCLMLITVELPGWTLRRLVYDEGEWHCALSNQPNLPVELDDTVDASHHDLSLALLLAFVTARRDIAAITRESETAPKAEPAATYVVCCDNFA
jgi:hypothetical protein